MKKENFAPKSVLNEIMEALSTKIDNDKSASVLSSINAFINNVANIVDLEEFVNSISSDDECKCEDKCECDKDKCADKCKCTCSCESNNDKCTCTCNKNEDIDDTRTPAERLKEYYDNEEARKKMEFVEDQVMIYINKNLYPTEKGGLIEKCGDVLKMPIADRAIVADYNFLDIDTKTDLVNKLIETTGFSGISFQTCDKTDLYVLFRF